MGAASGSDVANVQEFVKEVRVDGAPNSKPTSSLTGGNQTERTPTCPKTSFPFNVSSKPAGQSQEDNCGDPQTGGEEEAERSVDESDAPGADDREHERVEDAER